MRRNFMQNLILSTTEIYEKLRLEIINLDLAPCEVIGEIDTAKRFNVSRTPIREVFKRLEYDGLVNIVKNRGTEIAPINLKKILEYMFVREKVELGIIEDKLFEFEEGTILQLSLMLLEQQQIVADTKLPIEIRALEFFSADNLFHETLFKAANHLELWDFLLTTIPDYQRFRALSAAHHTQEQLLHLCDEHAQLLFHIRNKDFACVKSVYKQHIFGGVNHCHSLLEAMPQYFISRF